MVVVSKPAVAAVDQFSLIKTCKPTNLSSTKIPVIDLTSQEEAKSQLLVKACEEFGFFKVVNHGVPMELIKELEDEAIKFFNLGQDEKEKAGTPSPFGYGNKKIGPNGDVGWLEYLLFSADPDSISQISLSIFPHNPHVFRSVVTSYIAAVKRMVCGVLESIAEGLKVEEKSAFSKMLKDEKSDSCFRLNHYPPWPAEAEYLGAALSGRNLIIGFGEHTDPQIISALRSNNTAGLQISLADGTWLSVPPDHSSFFINVGDSLQVMTNGRFKSVKHRVLVEGMKSRVSMIYFGGPPLCEKIAPLPCLLQQAAAGHKESLYEEFTWWEYKKAAYKSRLVDNRLELFERKSPTASSTTATTTALKANNSNTSLTPLSPT
ncbi:Gibberellin 2-beta-dioxygenase [Ancistrocladus abbreviatus]